MDRKLVLAGIIILVILGAASWYFIAQNSSMKTSSNSTSSTGGTSQYSAGSSSTQQNATAADAVSIKDMMFTPANITVKKGATVTWTNNDSVTHTVTETDSQTGPDSSGVAPGATYTFAFSQTGTYHYHCSIHPSMTGIVTVTD